MVLKGFGIGKLSHNTGVNIETIRYYERIGLMPDPGRTSGGTRQYDNDHMKRLTFIKRCRGLGFRIEEIRKLLQMVDCRDFTCRQVNRMTLDHLATVREKIANLQKLEASLTSMAAECGCGSVPECPIIDALFE